MIARVLACLALLASAVSVGGCGQTGPLHLPADAPARENYLIGADGGGNKKKAASPSSAPAAAPAATPAEVPVEVPVEAPAAAPSPPR